MSREKSDGPVLTRRKFALGLAFAGAAGVGYARQPSEKIDYLGKNKLDKVLPEKLGRWTFVSSSGLVVPPEDQLARALYSQLLTRVYADKAGTPGRAGAWSLPPRSCFWWRKAVRRPASYKSTGRKSATRPAAIPCRISSRTRCSFPAVQSRR